MSDRKPSSSSSTEVPSAELPASPSREAAAQTSKKGNIISSMRDRVQGVQVPAFDIQETRNFLGEKLAHTKIDGLDYKERDPRQLHSEIRVNFKDVIAEPAGAHSFDTVWGTSFKTYSVTKFWAYRILTAVLGIPFALFWGFYFACLAFINVWCVVPFVKGFVIQMNFFKQVWQLLVGTFLDPFFMSMGKIFSQIKIHLSMNRS